MKILISGASSYIGRYVTEAFLNEGDLVYTLYRDTINTSLHPLHKEVKPIIVSKSNLSVDIYEAIKATSPQCIIHLGGATFNENEFLGRNQTLEANFHFGWHLLNAALQNSVSYFINAGSFWSYGDVHLPKPNSLYSFSKLEFQKFLEYYADAQQLKVISLVLFDVYGPFDPRNKVLNVILESMKNNASIEMTGGEQFLDLVHVEDVANGFVKASRLITNELTPNISQFSLRSGTLYNLRSIVEIVSRVSGKKIDVQWGSKPYQKNQIFQPIQSITTLPNWSAKQLTDGLTDIIMNNKY